MNYELFKKFIITGTKIHWFSINWTNTWKFPFILAVHYHVSGILNVEVHTHIGVIYNAFLIGLEVNLNTILDV